MKQILEKIASDLCRAKLQAETQIASERLGGNIVKENFWRGQLSGLSIAISTISIQLTLAETSGSSAGASSSSNAS